jgi:pimeloyl-ACP methyl ester carboxylesterase
MVLPVAQQTIVIIHGFGGHRWLMAPLAGRLRRDGFEVVNWGYHSLFNDIETHAGRFRAVLADLQNRDSQSPFHIVAHSMGSLITRRALLDYHPSKLKRIVLLCPPNNGSHIASLYARPFGWLSKPLVQISDMPDSFARRLPTDLADRYEVGIVAASTDFVVRPESTHLPGVEQYAVVPALHSSILFKGLTARLVASFINCGQFAVGSQE